MKTSNRIVWIDDNPTRERTAEELGTQFINARGARLEDLIEKLLKGKQPRLVILDHILDKTAGTNPLFKRGSTFAEAIKEQWPSCPVIGVTSVSKIEDIDQRTRLTYDELLPFHNFGEYIDLIRSVAKGFALIGRQIPSNARKAVDLLKPPDSELDRLIAALPHDLKEPFLDASTASRLYRWVHHLMARAGFLYDKLWASTLVGLNEQGFEKVEEQFVDGKYKGVFATQDRPRWWSSRLTEILYKKCEPQPGELSWNVGRRLPSIKKVDFSRCYRCNDEFPETVAYLDAESDEARAMHLSCTVLHPRYKRELYFEDVRMMRDN